MHDWNFTPDKKLSLTLAADARLGSTDYANDQIWDFSLGSSEPPAISLETTFGLRARLCRIFPRFIYKGNSINDPAQFSSPFIIHRYFPNYLEVTCKPFSFINVKLEYWVPNSQVIAGRIKLTNTTHDKHALQMELAELLLPSGDGSRMIVKEMGMTTLLSGRTANISPILFLTGGAQAGKSPFPSLELSLEIPSHGNYQTYWAHASSTTDEDSFAMVKEVINKNWDAEFARITRINDPLIEINTGNKDWDNAFRLSQNLSFQLFLKPQKNNQAPSIVSTRKPDQGYSLLGDGSDYNHQWNGQTPFASSYLVNFLLPTSPELLRGLLDNFLAVQTPQGEIDLKPGMAAQRSHLLATPLLADIALQISEYDEDDAYLRSIFPKLYSFFQTWFSDSHDRDGDQFPEWDHPIQTGLEDFPLFTQYHIWSWAADITTLEAPSLCAYLYRECTSLINISKKIKNYEVISELETYAKKLKSMVEQTWSEQDACYLYCDRDTHICSIGEILGKRSGEGIIEINRDFQTPVRPIVFIESQQDVTHPTRIFIHGTGNAGIHRIEQIPSSHIHWQHQCGHSTSPYTYFSIEHVEVAGLRQDDIVTIKTGHTKFVDISLLLPLWAGIPSKERAKILINLTIMNNKKFLGHYGLRTWIETSEMEKIPDEYYGSNLPWTSLILDGLIRYGEQSKASEIFIRLMEPVVTALQKNLSLYHSFHFKTGKPLGIQNSISSLIPIGLFLKILGVKIINPYCVELNGTNPFPWPVSIKYQGLTIIKQERKTRVVFPDEQSISVDNERPRRISCNTIIIEEQITDEFSPPAILT